jgi:hypothetical protein
LRWAAGTAVTALDLCAATIARLHDLKIGKHERSMRDLDPANVEVTWPASPRCLSKLRQRRKDAEP